MRSQIAMCLVLLCFSGCDRDGSGSPPAGEQAPATGEVWDTVDRAGSSVRSAASVAATEVRPAFTTVPEDTKFRFSRAGCNEGCEDLDFSVDASGEVTGSRESTRRLAEREVLELLNSFARVDFMYLEDSVVASCTEEGPTLELAMRAGAHENSLTFSQGCEAAEVEPIERLAEMLVQKAYPEDEQ